MQMPKPENPGSQGKGREKNRDRVKKTKTMEFWVAKGWTAYVFLAGEEVSDVIPMDPETQDLELKGHPVFGADGNILKRSPHMSVAEVAGGAEIRLSTPATTSIAVLYKITEEEDEDEETDDQFPLLGP